MRSTIIAIDPGKSGGIVVLSQKKVTWTPMPSTEQDIADLIKDIAMEHEEPMAVIEKVHAMPGQGVTSMFTFGMGYGGLRMACICNQLPLWEVHPKTWQKALQIPPRTKTESKPQFKERIRGKAQLLFPKLDLWKMNKSKGKQLAVCDALLIAIYAERFLVKG